MKGAGLSLLPAPVPEGFLVLLLRLALDAAILSPVPPRKMGSTPPWREQPKGEISLIRAQVLALTVILYYLHQGPAAEASFSSSSW